MDDKERIRIATLLHCSETLFLEDEKLSDALTSFANSVAINFTGKAPEEIGARELLRVMADAVESPTCNPFEHEEALLAIIAMHNNETRANGNNDYARGLRHALLALGWKPVYMAELSPSGEPYAHIADLERTEDGNA